MDLPDPARSRAVLIGVDHYDHLDDLPAVRNNVRHLAELLMAPDLWGLPLEQCAVLENPPSTDAVLDVAVSSSSGRRRRSDVRKAPAGVAVVAEQPQLRSAQGGHRR
ncbi:MULTISPECIES: hypothetical protein [Streptomyces]|uniref:Uncharacterized protein n=1 Tax=Streptomyces doebereineriae TaxID=3075528 RepID=A0ABU2VAL5_9ACTN|nr:hypothetical protein [Streptomyces sp. DSM 41640]MDT0482601.1 hypothetical protein [Streptomyces sp. DSM 41640]